MKRVLSALILGSLVVAAVAASPPALVAVLVAAAVFLGLLEMRSLAAHAGINLSFLPSAAGSAVLVAGAAMGGDLGLAKGLAGAVVLMVLFRLLAGRTEGTFREMGAELTILIFPAWALSHAILFTLRPGGRTELLFLLAVIWTCDTVAFLVGTAWGRRHLAEAISPRKTVEGLVAGIAAGVAGAAVFRVFIPLPWGEATSLLLGGALAFLGQLGDLLESLMKRDAHVKDSGGIIPGHGGMLDRVDALFLALPVFYYAVRWLEGARW